MKTPVSTPVSASESLRFPSGRLLRFPPPFLRKGRNRSPEERAVPEQLRDIARVRAHARERQPDNYAHTRED